VLSAKMGALTASMRKLLCIVNAMPKNEQNWQPNLIEKAWFLRQSLRD